LTENSEKEGTDFNRQHKTPEERVTNPSSIDYLTVLEDNIMWSFGRNNAGRVEDPNPPETQQRNAQSNNTGNNNPHHRQYYERPMTPQQQVQPTNLGRGRHNFKKSNYPAAAKYPGSSSNNQKVAQSPRNNNNNHPPASPRQSQTSPREYQRNNNRNFKVKKRFGGPNFLHRRNASADYSLQEGMNVDETTNGIEVTFEPPGPKTPQSAGYNNKNSNDKNNGNKGTPTNSTSSSPSKRMHYKNRFSPRNNNTNTNNNNNGNQPRRKEEDRDPSVAEEESAPRSIQPAISFSEQFRLRQRIYKSQFQTTLIPETTTTIVSPLQTSISWRPQGHRIPLCGVKSPPITNVADVIQLLQASTVVDERSAVQQELSHLNAEIDALQRDRTTLEGIQKSLAASSLAWRFPASSGNGRGLERQCPFETKCAQKGANVHCSTNGTPTTTRHLSDHSCP
jgi:hypothetical protein